MRSTSTHDHTLQLPDVLSRLRHPLWLTSAALFLLALLMLVGKSGGGIATFLFITPFTFGPMIVSLLLGVVAASRKSLAWLLIANILYLGWFLWLYRSAFYLHPDAQAGLVFLFVGIYSLPVMIPLWIVAMYSRRSKHSKSA